jgi:hypothetical protein
MAVRTFVSIFCFMTLVPYMSQQPHMLNIEAQRAAMKELEFMVGKWAGGHASFGGQAIRFRVES